MAVAWAVVWGIWPCHPAADRAVVTDLVWWLAQLDAPRRSGLLGHSDVCRNVTS
jgi:hypothetical protein